MRRGLTLGPVLSVVYISISFSFYYQLLSPEREILAPSRAYNLSNMQRGPYNPQSGYQYPAPAVAPPTTEDWVPPYDPAKVPDYYESQGIDLGDKKGDDAKSYHSDNGPPGLGYTGGSSHGH